MSDVSGKVALVTGAAQGIGYAIARKLALAGASVSLSDIRLEAVERAAGQLCAETGLELGTRVHGAEVDVSRSEQVRAWVEQAVSRWGGIHVLVNNAGIQLNRASLEMTDEEWRQVMSVDLDGVFYCSREVGRVMVRQGAGSIINLSSVAERFGLPRRLPYGVAKAGVSALSRVLAAEWAEHGVRVNAIAPGYVQTELVSYALEQGHLRLPELVAKIPMGRLTEPEQIAEMALFLASERSAYVTGQVLFVDGGYSISK